MGAATGQPAGGADPPPKNHWRATLLTSPEGRILLLGVALTLGYTLWLAAKLLWSPEEAQLLIGLTATELLFGQATALAFGYSLGLEHGTVIPVCMIVETIFVLIFYPLFVFSWRHLLVIGWLRNTFDKVHKAAETHRHKIRKYGIIGLFIFVWFPFWMTGAAVGCVIGFLLELPAWLNMTIVLGGTYAATLSWALVLRHVHERVAAYSSYAPLVLVILLILIVVVGHVLQRTLHENRNKH